MVRYAQEQLSELIATMSVAATPLDGTMSRCQVNGFFREYIMSRLVEEKLFFPLEISALEKGHRSLITERIGQHLAIGTCWRRDRIVLESLDLSRLRSLIVFGEWQSFFVSEKMRVLRVLDLENATHVTEDDLEKMVKILPCLKFLSLRGTRVIALPRSIIKLPKLQHIRASGALPPRGMGKLTARHTIGDISISGRGGKAILEELKNLTQLRKLGSLKLYGHAERLPGSIKDLCNLVKLSLELVTFKREDIEVIEKLEKLHTLRLGVRKIQDSELQFGAWLDDSGHSSSKLFLNLKLYRLEHLVSLLKVSLKGSYDNTLKEALQQQLDEHPIKPVLKLEQPSSSRLVPLLS
ncbi:hypothetical protein C2845_PMPSC049110 [Panicum miliaceum]|uniref:Disease resistance R13L4/SHOC-2-like LRR domain-containing protein n=1 Tax=Panicum miliaceum TaxID=4540 RepID=A0A3L6P9K3_PANMI|nr:hypothetical protein C2845_PMPSC049110 [Panicum miliaceum]